MKYAHLESERRFLLASLPPLDGARVLQIIDRYVHRSRLRVRLVEEAGQDPVRKLGQKERLDESAPSVNAHTTLYLDEAEFQLLSALPAAVLRKTRYVLDGWAFDEHETGLLLAETEGPDEPWFGFTREVTDELAYTGGELAKKSTSRPPS